MSFTAEELRKAIENLIDAKLQDALYRPGGMDRLRAHRLTGVASPDIRNAERRLDEVLESIATPPAPASSKSRTTITARANALHAPAIEGAHSEGSGRTRNMIVTRPEHTS